MIKDLRAEHLRTVVITDLHIADQPLAKYKPFEEGIAGDHFVKNPDGTIYEGVSVAREGGVSGFHSESFA